MLADVFLVLAVLGGVVVVGQLALALVLGTFGHGGDASHGHGHDQPHFDTKEHAGGWLFGMLSIRAIATGIAVFGLIGMAALSGGFDHGSAIALASVAALVTAWIIGQFMRSLKFLHGSGTIKTEAAVDRTAEVYVTIPASYKGRGKVTVELQGRTVELAAVTFGPELKTGASVRVVQMVDPETVEVIASPFAGDPNP